MLPEYYMITSDDNYAGEVFLNKLIEHLVHGQKLIQLRIKNVNLSEFVAISKVVIIVGRRTYVINGT